ncbi:MAG: hypothetical protein JOZ38_10280 [Candidatus Eremiobacteraeota bacterium]|nr:hypothetical protein [Candidatus Eremiobacteraeota bacterium]
MKKMFTRPLALLTLVALAACSGSSNSTSAPAAVPPQTGNSILTTIVGVGDSLTAGVESGGLLGDPTATSPASNVLPGNAVPPTQENGFFYLLTAQAKGATAAQAAVPLIKAPGLGSQLVYNTATFIAPSHPSCDSFNQAAFALSSASTTQLSTSAPANLDLGIPGITTHEALTMNNPLTGPAAPPGCTYPVIPGDPTSGSLQTLLSSESNNFYPVLYRYASSVSPLTEVGAAVSAKPTLATVWLGANDILHYTFSGGLATFVDTPQQFQTDLTSIVTQLQHAGARVVVANLPDILSTPQFTKVSNLSNAIAATYNNLGLAALTAQGKFPPLAALQAEVPATQSYLQTTYGVGPNGYLLESGYLTTIGAIATALATSTSPAPALDPSGKGSGMGSVYLIDSFAATVSSMNTAYNGAITNVASATGAPLVDIHAIFAGITAAGNVACIDGSAPPNCNGQPGPAGSKVTLNLFGGLTSLDGLHPSNTGYALIANAYIQTIDTAFGVSGASLPPLGAVQIATIKGTDPNLIIQFPTPLAPTGGIPQ